MTKARIVVVEDEEDIRELLEYVLTREGFAVTSVADGRKGLAEVRKQLPDLVLLDLMLPGMDGLEVCSQLKQDEDTREVAVVMLTAKGEESDIVVGLRLGADDYITKPFSSKEMVARLQAVIRRSSRAPSQEDQTIQHGSLRIDPNRHQAWNGETSLDLTATEFKILHHLARQPGRVFTRDQILTAARGDQAIATDRSVDAHVRTIRKKLGENRALIETIHAVGYRLKEM
ncbi:MAG: response regulator [Planctomycetota bacterium]|jgi:two-component system phosphate regulon response regulator PhoB